MQEGRNDFLKALSKGKLSSSSSSRSIQKFPILTEKQKSIYDIAVRERRNVFFSGPAGVGKSLTLRQTIIGLQALHGSESVFVTATTGIAATHINGTTVHSFAGVGTNYSNLDAVMKNVWKYGGGKRWKAAKVLVIDEISMMSSELFTMLDLIGRRVNSDQKNKPFGGIQVIVTGDFMQLPPVDKEYERRRRQNPSLPPPTLLFECKAWKQTIQESVLLTEVQRQKDLSFVSMLQNMRFGALTDEDAVLLRERIGVDLETSDGIKATRIYSHNANVHEENEKRLAELPGEVRTFASIDAGKDKFAIQKLKDNCLAPSELKLKVGALVMLLKNLAPPKLVNGTLGKVIRFSKRDTSSTVMYPVVQFDSGIEILVTPDSWETMRGDEILAKRTQVPLRLAWAVSIHKCQGMTISRAVIDISSCWADGQAYVAISRCTELKGLSLLKDFNRERVIKANERCVQYYAELGDPLAAKFAVPPPPPPPPPSAEKKRSERKEEEEENQQNKKAKTSTVWWEQF